MVKTYDFSILTGISWLKLLVKVCIKKILQMLQAGKWEALLQRPKSGWKRP